jgi:pilus assembly protein CpaC
MRSLPARCIALLVAALVLGAVRTAPAQDSGLVRLDITIGRSQVLDLREPSARVSVTNPAVADAFVITPSKILINGKAVGATSLVVFYPDTTLFFDVVVHTDTALLAERLREITPRDDIRVTAAQDAIVLSGSATSQRVIGAATEIATIFAPRGRVINLVSLVEAKTPQVMLQVQVAEVARQALRELGINFRALGSTFQGAAFPGALFFPPIGTVGSVSAGGSPIGRSTPDFLFDGVGFFLSSGRRDYAGVVRALAERDLLRTLAKPNLVTESGKEAKFLSGGEFPFPVAQELNRVTIEWKEFGVGLLFTPSVVDGETINLRVRPEVSSLDFASGLTFLGFRFPAIRKNEAFTTVNLKDGESFAIAGLINNEVRQTVQKIPLLGDIPILGALFRSTRFLNNETELLFLVTVKLVKAEPPGSPATPDPRALMELRPDEKRELTQVPGIPGVGHSVDRPFGQHNLPGPR